MNKSVNVDLSVIVTIVSGRDFLEECLCKLVPQMDGHLMEIIVPYDSTVNYIGELTPRFPHIKFLEMARLIKRLLLKQGLLQSLLRRRLKKLGARLLFLLLSLK